MSTAEKSSHSISDFELEMMGMVAPPRDPVEDSTENLAEKKESEANQEGD